MKFILQKEVSYLNFIFLTNKYFYPWSGTASKHLLSLRQLPLVFYECSQSWSWSWTYRVFQKSVSQFAKIKIKNKRRLNKSEIDKSCVSRVREDLALCRVKFFEISFTKPPSSAKANRTKVKRIKNVLEEFNSSYFQWLGNVTRVVGHGRSALPLNHHGSSGIGGRRNVQLHFIPRFHLPSFLTKFDIFQTRSTNLVYIGKYTDQHRKKLFKNFPAKKGFEFGMSQYFQTGDNVSKKQKNFQEI